MLYGGGGKGDRIMGVRVRVKEKGYSSGFKERRVSIRV